MPTRVDGDLFVAAKTIGAISSRSAAQQLNHWARIGRELEASPVTSPREIQRVLAGDASYDALGERDQAIVRANWDEQIADRLAKLDLAAEFTAAGRTWTDADEQGNPVTRSGADDSAATSKPGANPRTKKSKGSARAQLTPKAMAKQGKVVRVQVVAKSKSTNSTANKTA